MSSTEYRRPDTEIAHGIVRGDSYEKLTRLLGERFTKVSRNDAYRLIYTEGTFVMSESTLYPFAEDFRQYRISPVKDGKACGLCTGIAGQVFDIADRQAGVNFPPLHPWCRCTWEIVVDDWDAWVDEYERKHGNGKGEEIAERLNDESENGIIERKMASGRRTSHNHILTSDEIKMIEQAANELNIPLNMLRINYGRRTGYVEETDKIHIRGDVLPDENSLIARDRMSIRAVLAHEYYGHRRNSPSPYEIDDWHDEFKASYDAAIYAPILSDQERADLMLDAYDRARENGIILEYDEKARRIIYGYEIK